MKKYIRTKDKSLPMWLVLIGIIVIPFLSYSYNDTIFLIRYGVNVAGSIFEGDGLLSFYTYNQIKMEELQAVGKLAQIAVYDFPIYLVLGIWNFPLWLIGHVTGADPVETFGGIVWGKGLFLLFTFICAILICKICRQMQMEEKDAICAMVLFLTSIVTFSSVYIIGQCDVIVIAFILLGTLSLMQGKRKWFVLWFAVAISMKMFALFIFVALLLLAEKNIIKIGLQAMAGISLTMISRLAFMQQSNAGVEVKDGFERYNITTLLSNKLPLFNATVPVVLVFLAAVFLFCYMKRTQEKDLSEYIIYVSLLAILTVLISFQATPYWFMYMVPYVAILTMLHKERLNENFFLELLGLGGLFVSHLLVYYWCYDVGMTRYMLLEKLFGAADTVSNPVSLMNLIEKLNIRQYNFIGFTLFLVAMGAYCYLNRPQSRISEAEIGTSEKMETKKLLYLRAGVVVLISYVPIGFYFVNRIASLM